MGFDLVTSMTQGIQKSTVVLCCVDSEYSKSTNCMLELRHAAKVMPIYLGPYLSPYLGPYIAPYLDPHAVPTELSPVSLRPCLCGVCLFDCLFDFVCVCCLLRSQVIEDRSICLSLSLSPVVWCCVMVAGDRGSVGPHPRTHRRDHRGGHAQVEGIHAPVATPAACCCFLCPPSLL